MKNELVTKSLAKLAKKKGFDWKCQYFYNLTKLAGNNGKIQNAVNLNFSYNFNDYKDIVSIPTYYSLQEWLRETHDIDVLINPAHTEKGNKYYFIVITQGENYDVYDWQSAHSDILEKSYQNIKGNYLNNDLYEKFIFEDKFGFVSFKTALNKGLNKALKLIE